ncbi:MAG: AsmA-like C-terminal region-containing protein [Salibacteraceae bacterium]
MKWIKRLVIWSLLLLGLLVGTGVLISVVFGDEVKQYIVGQLSKQLTTPVNVDEVDFSVFKRFPNASVDFTNVVALENYVRPEGPDTLFAFEEVYLQFNIWDLINRNYRITRIQAYHGFAHIFIDKEGYDNFHIWKSTSQDTTEFFFELQDVQFEDLRFRYDNDYKGEHFAIDGQDVAFQGAFSEKQYQLAVDGELFVHRLQVRKNNYISQRNIKVSSKIDVDRTNDSYTFEGGKLTVDRILNFEIAGALHSKGMDLHIEGKDLDIVSTKALLTKDIQAYLNGYESEGFFSFEADVKGAFSKTEVPSVEARFGIENGTIIEKSTDYRLEKVTLRGSFSNGSRKTASSSTIVVEELDARLGRGHLNASFQMTNLLKPKVKAHAKAELDLGELAEFLSLDTIKSANGDLDMDVTFEGTIRDPKNITPRDFVYANCSGKVGLANASLRLEDDPHRYDSINGDFAFRNNDLLVKQLKGVTEGGDFQVHGVFRNLLAYLFLNNQRLAIEAEVQVQRMLLDEILAAGPSEEGLEDTYRLEFPQDIAVNLRMKVAELRFRRFRAERLTGVVKLLNGRFSAEPVACHTMKGTAHGKVILRPLPNGNFQLSTDFKVRDIDLQAMFYQMENFTQEVLLDRHLKGRANAKGNLFTEITPGLQLLEEPLVAGVDLKVNDGELIDFEPLMGVTDYLRTKKLMSKFLRLDEMEQELKHIRFSTLSNHIGIRNRTVSFPKMEIRSSVMNMEVSGTHTFDNAIDYVLSFNLAEVLSLSNPEKNDFVEVDEKGRSRMWIHMFGTVENPEFEMEKVKIRTHLLAGVEQKAEAVKTAVKKEIEKLKNGTLHPDPVEPEKEMDFVIEWEEDTTLTKAAAPAPTTKDTLSSNATLNKLLHLMESKEKQSDFGTKEISDEDDDY